MYIVQIHYGFYYRNDLKNYACGMVVKKRYTFIIYYYIKNKNIFLWYLLAKIIGCHFPNLRAIAQNCTFKNMDISSHFLGEIFCVQPCVDLFPDTLSSWKVATGIACISAEHSTLIFLAAFDNSSDTDR